MHRDVDTGHTELTSLVTRPLANRHLDVLRRVTRQMTATRDLPAVLASIVTGLVEQADAAIARVWLYTTEDGCPLCRSTRSTSGVRARMLHLAATAGFRTELAGPHHAVRMGGTGGPGLIAETRIPVYINDIPNYSKLALERPYHDFDLTSLDLYAGVGYPLLVHDELVGVLGMITRRPIPEEEFEHLGIFADQAATAIKSAQLYEELDRYKERLLLENACLQNEIREEGGFSEVVGGSPALRAVLRKVRQVAAADTTVLLTGETGTGKELIARAIHDMSSRKQRSLIKVNCGAISQGLVESELFGHEKGAFTGALQRRIGRFELADKGTLFMDEVGELPAETQVKLLRVLQEQEFERVGGARPIRVDARLVAATNRDLEKEVAAGRFRADLYYRLNVFPIRIPPLRERVGDVPLLVRHYLAHFQRKLAKPLRGITEDSLGRLTAYSWPGNVRELQNVLERACVLASTPVIDVTDALSGPADSPAREEGPALIGTLADCERAHIKRALAATGGKIQGPRGAASILGLNPNTLRSRMEKLGISRR